MTTIYKICTPEQADALAAGPWAGAPVDTADGFVHLSAPDQVAGTLAKHFAGRGPLVLVAVDAARVPEGCLRWEVSRGGARFPHVYAPLEPGWVTAWIPLDADHRLPDGLGT